jgi:hypothetical protein
MGNVKVAAVTLGTCAVVATYFLAAAHGQGKDVPELNRKVLKFAQDHTGEQVGNGECWTLAADALAHAGAQRPGVNGVPVNTFGRKLDPKSAILPGDVVQFEKAKFEHKTETATSWQTMPHHTAIVSKVDGKTISILHQNYAGKRTVGAGEIVLTELTEGTVEFFRPVPRRR